MAIVGCTACDSSAAFSTWQQKVAAPVRGSVMVDKLRDGVESDTRLSQLQKTLLESRLPPAAEGPGLVDVQL